MSNKEHKAYISNNNCNPLLNLKFDSTSDYPKLDLVIKEVTCLWSFVSEIIDSTMKYQFWLTTIIEPDEFFDIDDVQKYLTQNMSEKDMTPDQLESKLIDLNGHLQLKFMNLIREVSEIVKPIENAVDEQCDEIEQKNENKLRKEVEKAEEIKFQMAVEQKRRETDSKINMLITENENLKVIDSEYSKQINILMGESQFRNNKLVYSGNQLLLSSKEKSDLISVIGKKQVKNEGYETLQNRFEKLREQNKRLIKVIVERGYAKKPTVMFI